MDKLMEEDFKLVGTKIIDKLFDDFSLSPSRVGPSGKNDGISITYIDDAKIRTLVIEVHEDSTISGYITRNFEIIYEQYMGNKMTFKKIVKMFREMV